MPEVIVRRIDLKRRARIPASTADVAVKAGSHIIVPIVRPLFELTAAIETIAAII